MVGMWNSLPEELVQAPTLNAFKASKAGQGLDESR